MTNSTEPFVAIGIVIHDDTELTANAQDTGGVIAAVRVGPRHATTIQSSSPAALRRLAAALNAAADKAEAITEAGK
jgi:hypothetical protein